MKHFAKRLTALTLALGLCSYNLNALAVTSSTNTPLVINAQGFATFSSIIAASATDFNDLFTFTTVSGSGGASSIASFNGSIFSVGFTVMNLLDLTHGNTVVATGLVGPSFVSQIGFSGLNPNTTYGLNIVGTVANPGLLSYYSGSLSVSPVPENDKFMLLACGLGLFGIIASRRKQDVECSTV